MKRSSGDVGQAGARGRVSFPPTCFRFSSLRPSVSFSERERSVATGRHDYKPLTLHSPHMSRALGSDGPASSGTDPQACPYMR